MAVEVIRRDVGQHGRPAEGRRFRLEEKPSQTKSRQGILREKREGEPMFRSATGRPARRRSQRSNSS
jgi:hypothetical protein